MERANCLRTAFKRAVNKRKRGDFRHPFGDAGIAYGQLSAGLNGAKNPAGLSAQNQRWMS